MLTYRPTRQTRTCPAAPRRPWRERERGLSPFWKTVLFSQGESSSAMPTTPRNGGLNAQGTSLILSKKPRARTVSAHESSSFICGRCTSLQGSLPPSLARSLLPIQKSRWNLRSAEHTCGRGRAAAVLVVGALARVLDGDEVRALTTTLSLHIV